MLSILGKVSAVVTIAGGALMLNTPAAMATELRDCTEGEVQYACSTGVPSYQDGNGDYWCGYYAGGCVATDGPNGTEVTWNIQYFWNGTYPCPSVQPC